MRSRWCLGLMALFAVSMSVGCSMTGPTVRGQGPDNSGPIIGSAPGYGELKKTPYLGRHGSHDFRPYSAFRDEHFGYEGGFTANPNYYSTDRNNPYVVNGTCPDCNNGAACPQGGCHRCGRGCGQHGGIPHHYQTYQYNWPENMVYPQQGVPSGMVQYPYYTLRGPTDFFMDKNP